MKYVLDSYLFSKFVSHLVVMYDLNMLPNIRGSYLALKNWLYAPIAAEPYPNPLYLTPDPNPNPTLP